MDPTFNISVTLTFKSWFQKIENVFRFFANNHFFHLTETIMKITAVKII